MDRYIGLDVHAQSCTFVVLNQKGKRLKETVVETNGWALVEFVRLIPGTRHLCVEEGTQSQWVYEILSPHVEEMAVVRAEKRHGNKDDSVDAFELAERMRTGAIRTKIFKAPKTFVALRELTHIYAKVTGDLVRTKNRIKALYRSRGIRSATKTQVFERKSRQEALRLLRPETRQAVGFLYREHDHLEELKADVQKAMLAEAGKHSIAKILKTAPGLGPIRVAQILPIVVTPHRFRTRGQFWSYSGFAVVHHTSSDWVTKPEGGLGRSRRVSTRGLNRNCNPTLKMIFKGAATTVVSEMPTNPLYSDYQRIVSGGLDPAVAKVTIARKIAAIVLAMWKKKEVYNPAKYQSNQA